MKRVLSGIKPSGEVTIGNYLGAMKRWAAEQEGRENFYFVPNLHALNYRPDPVTLRNQTLGAVVWLMVMGVDTKHSAVFVQSQISAHSELCWILNNFVTMGELSRMTQFKDKSRKLGSEGQVVGLFDYPVLMAADILLYDANEIPVGDDQKQHVELVRDIAERFNTVYGDTFVLPEPTIQKVGARIMNLQDPSRKMSASDGELSSGIIWLSDDADLMRQKIMRAVTDSSNEVRAGQDKPALTNLLQIYSSITGKPIADIERQYHDEGYGKFKADLGDVVAEELAPLQKAFTSTRSDEAAVLRLLEEGRLKAEPIAMSKLAEVKSRVGLL